MKATSCIFHRYCRRQQELAKQELPVVISLPTDPTVCQANRVGCDDHKLDMDKRCEYFLPLQRPS